MDHFGMIFWIKANRKLPTKIIGSPLILDEALDKDASSYRAKNEQHIPDMQQGSCDAVIMIVVLMTPTMQ